MALGPLWAWLRSGSTRQGLLTAAWPAGKLECGSTGFVGELLSQCRTLHGSAALGFRNKAARRGAEDEWGWNPLLRSEESAALGADEIRWALQRAEELAERERESVGHTGNDERVRGPKAMRAEGGAVVENRESAKKGVVETRARAVGKNAAHIDEGRRKGEQIAGGVKARPKPDGAKAGVATTRESSVRRQGGQLGGGTQPRRLGFGVHKEAPWSGRFQVRQGAALTGDLWNEVAPDVDEGFRQSAAEQESVDGAQDIAESVRGTTDGIQTGAIGRSVGEAVQEESQTVPGVFSEQGLESGNRLDSSCQEASTSERGLDSFEGEGRDFAGRLSGAVRIEEEAQSTGSRARISSADGTSPWGAESDQLTQQKSTDIQTRSSSARSGEAASEDNRSLETLEETDARVMDNAPTRDLSERQLGRSDVSARLSEDSDGSDRFLDDSDASERVPDLEELRTWLTQLDRQGEGELEEEEKEERQGSASVPVEKQKSLRLAIMGPPNAGKSVLTNALVGTKVSAVSAKTNTTRAPIIGVSTHRTTQLVVCDTPGLASLAPGRELRSTNQQLVNRAQRAGADCDVVIVVIDVAREIERPDPRIPRMIAKLGEQLPTGQKHALVLNKVDAVGRADRPKLEELCERLMMLHAFDRCFVTSGKRGLGLKQLYRYLRKNAVLRPWELPEGRPTDLSDEQRAMDIVRQHLLDRLHKEIPYKVVVKPVGWAESGDGVLEIRQDLIVDRKKIKAMVVGKKGATIKQITLGAREELGEILGRRIELFLNIRVEGT
ncbi:hypothetical protein KFL_001550150 [Klebsormidium nitens]|uniref:KH type-2 domain-containing protein n=1 Tax=Klebsormidium nitens TaxID=105231 RepID=A0A1Y1HY97_KLENI|nr:hypothetical protein KFL_001550150 [Klebsormidium nitens]|eukprot:GAQ83625.1 hypothetical protein KFL_001550150 [Klebsormidium nitens]